MSHDFLPAGAIVNGCPGCEGRGYNTRADLSIPDVEHFLPCTSCFGSGRDQAHCIDDTIPVARRDALHPAEAPGPVDIDAVRAGFMAASIEENRESQRLLVYELVLVLPKALRELEELRAEIRMLKSIVRIHVPPRPQGPQRDIGAEPQS